MQPPGLLRAAVNPDVLMMICTAGHVDHGKTALVRLLTGCNTDRLKEEQERGLTIELGFAPCVLGGGLCVGIVDVPGHEKFIRNMVAGVSGIDLTILVVAADDGIMPQTVEHFRIMELMGVRHGLVALTKTDLVSPERVEEVRGHLRAFLAGTFMADAPICPVSSETGDGVFAFYDELVARIGGLVRRRKGGIFRMPVERAFTQKGFGTVVTGIPVDGTIETGAEVELAPGGPVGRVRAIQRFLRDAREGGYGQCLAINVPEFGKAAPERGQVLCRPGYLQAVWRLYVSVQGIGGLEKPLAHAENVKLHTGTAEVMARLFLLESKTLGEGQVGLASLALARPVAAAAHDRFILRRPSPAATVAGGEILAACATPLPLRKDALVERLAAYRALFEHIDPSSEEGVRLELEHLLRAERPAGARLHDLAKAALLPDTVAAETLKALDNVRVLEPDFYIHEEAYAARRAEVEARIQDAARKENLSLAVSELRKRFADWPGPLWDSIQASLEKGAQITVRGSRLVVRSAVEQLGEADRALVERIRKLYEDTGFQSPRPEELPELLQADPGKTARLLDYLVHEGSLVRPSRNVVLTREAFRQAQDIVVETIRSKGSLNSADFKYAIQSTRKYALAILDCLDARRVTVRAGNDRKLTPDYQKNLL